ncbi:MAG: penicillin acylase family protein [Cyclobacteriaceae bacterium]
MRLTTFLFSLIISSIGSAQIINPIGIEIMRDHYGVPHIYAKTDPEVAYGLAWAHAEDDFETIQLTLLGAKQMLGRHLGKSGAPVDYVVGLLDCEGVVRKHKSTLSEDFLSVLEGYVQGFNAYGAAHPSEVLVKKAFPVSVDDMLKAYVLSLSVILGGDKTIQSLVENKIEKIWEQPKGSNAIAISRNKTTDGQTYLAVNSHQPLTGPVSWYEAHLVSDQGWNALGGLFPGGATIFHGTNPSLGWAHTVNYPDMIDIWQLEMKSSKGNTYIVDGNELELEEKKVKLKVKILPGFRLTFARKAYSSIYGPVIKNDSGVFAFDLASLHEVRTPEQWYRMNKAKDFESFKSALEMMSLPMFNIIYADNADNIYYVSNALLPKRNPNYKWREVVPGNTYSTSYNEYFKFSDLPQLANPKAGYLFNTNHSPFLATASGENIQSTLFDKTMGYNVWNNNRSLRFIELINKYDKLNYQDFLRIKYDAQLPDSVVYKIDLNRVLDTDFSSSEELSDVLQILRQWDKNAETNSVGPAQFIELYYYINRTYNNGTNKEYLPLDKEIEEGLVFITNYFKKHFGKVNVSLGEYQKLVRGERKLPLRGMPDVLAAMYSQPHENGTVAGAAGESYIMMIRYPKEGLPVIETVNSYGASNRSSSTHYDDQMNLFVNKERKAMTLDINEVRKNAKKIYHPQ